ncbi:MAG: DUF1549 domain-containing protein [Acidobacteria bacterium]|nr:DUF1549 domain-containing protein [Acidobacteriota bacterium]
MIRMVRGLRLVLNLLFWLLIFVPMIVGEKPKPKAKDHPEPSAGQRKALDELTQSIGSRLPASPVIPVQRQNYIDDYILGKMERDRVPHAGLSSDTEFVRRVTLDLTGRLPEVEAIRSFVKDTNPDKRDKLIDSLVATPVAGLRGQLTTPFLDRWSYWFGDLFRINDGHLSKGREIFYDYLYSALQENLPYDQLVREMLTAGSRSNWANGPVNYLARDYVNETDDSIINNEDTYDQWAISSYKVFLGLSLECISCHDGAGHLEKINLWLSQRSREEVWNQAAFFAGSRLWRPYGDYSQFALTEDGKGYDLNGKSVTRIGRHPAKISPTFLLTGDKPQQGEGLREAYARMLTGNLQFAKTTVNLFWAELMGVGIVDPPFSFDLVRQDPKIPPPSPWTIQPTHPELLEALAKDFQGHKYDLRYLITLITKSSTYQLSSRFQGAWKQSYAQYFARHFVRRLPAVQVWDGIAQATGLFPEIPIRRSDRKVKYMGQILDPDDLNQKDMKPLADLVASFGLYSRFLGDDSSGSKGSIVQASILLNSPLIRERVRVQKGSRLESLLTHEPPYSNDQIVEELFLATLSRFPTADERNTAVKLLQDFHAQGAEDLLWSLINHLEFLAVS